MCNILKSVRIVTLLMVVLSEPGFNVRDRFNEILCLSSTVNPTFFIMTNSMSLSTHRLWRSRHTTSQQYAVKVCIPHIFIGNNQKYETQIHFYSVSVCSLSLVPRNQLLSVAAACKVLIEFSLMRLENPDEACAVSQVRNGKCTAGIHFEAEKSTEDQTNVFVDSSTETPDSSNKRTLHRLQQAGSHGNHHFHCYDEICKVASNRQNPFRWSVSHKVHEYLNSTKMIPWFFF